MNDTTPTIGITEWEDQTWVEIWDGEHGHNRSVIVAVADTRDEAKEIAVDKLCRLIVRLMDE